MARHNLTWRLVSATLGMFLATAWTAKHASAQYTFVQDTDNAGLWSDPAQWTSPPPDDYPNAVGAIALINAPTRLGGSGTYNLAMPASDVTVGQLTIDNANYNNSYRTNFTNGGDDFRLIFQNTSGPALYTETNGNAAGATNSQYRFLGKVRISSDLIIDQDNYPNLNTGTIFANLVEGASNRTITKEGQGGIQFEYNPLPGETTPAFQGQVVINQGDIRLLSINPFANVAGITVNTGGQLKLADNANNGANTEWNFGASPLTLNGLGKATGNNPEGALRFALGQISDSTVNNAVVLQSDSGISVTSNSATPSNLTGTLAGVVSGPGGLTKQGPGTLVIGGATNDTNAYTGDTTLLAGGPLSISNPFLANGADVYLTTGSVFNLNFSGSDTIRSLFIDGVPLPIGTYDSSTPATAAFITGSGSLSVTSVPAVGNADFDADGDVDGNDFLIWQRGVGTAGGQPQGNADGMGGIDGADLAIWRGQFGPGGPATPSIAGVPEPAAAFLALAAAMGIAALRRAA